MILSAVMHSLCESWTMSSPYPWTMNIVSFYYKDNSHFAHPLSMTTNILWPGFMLQTAIISKI